MTLEIARNKMVFYNVFDAFTPWQCLNICHCLEIITETLEKNRMEEIIGTFMTRNRWDITRYLLNISCCKLFRTTLRPCFDRGFTPDLSRPIDNALRDYSDSVGIETSHHVGRAGQLYGC